LRALHFLACAPTMAIIKAWGSGKGKGRKGAGKGAFGNQGGQWLFVPSGSKGFGKGFGKSFGKATGKRVETSNKFMDKLGKIDADKKVWIGGLSKDTTWKKLEKHFAETCGTKPNITELLPKGRGCCAFKNEDEASAAIAAVNGSDLNGKTIEVDVWTEKEKKPQDQKPKRKFSTAFAQRGKANAKDEFAGIDASLRVWIGNLSSKTNAGRLRKHFADLGCAVKKSKILKEAKNGKTGTGCLAFKTEEEASSAIAAGSGTELDGNALEVDVWTQVDKEERKAQREAHKAEMKAKKEAAKAEKESA